MKKLLLLLLSVCIAVQSYAQNVPSYVPTNGLVGWWPFTGNAIDSSGNGNNGSILPGVTLTSNRFNNVNSSYLFDGIDGGIPNQMIINKGIILPSNLNANSNFTITLWFKIDDTLKGAPNNTAQCFFNTNPYCTLAVGYNHPYAPNKIISCYGNSTSWVVCNNSNSWDFINKLSWHFLSVCKVNNQILYYLDGSLNKSVNLNYVFPALTSIQIGGIPVSTGEVFKGKLDDIGIWNRALTPCEIQSLYTGLPSTFNNNLITQDTIKACGDSVLVAATSGLSSYSWNTGATTSSVFAKNTGWYKVTGANAQGCSATDSVFVSILKANILNNDTTVCLGANLTLNAQQAPIGTSCTSSGLPNNLQNGLVGYWPFCGNANDMSGNGNNANINNAILTSDRNSQLNSAYYFNGNNYIEITSPSFTFSPQNNFSWSVWVKPDLPGQGAMTSGTTEAGNFVVGLWGGNGPISINGISFGAALQQGPWTGSNSSIGISTWTHLVAVFDSSKLKLYKNAQLISSVLYTSGGNPKKMPFRFGCDHAVNNKSKGIIDDAGVWNRALSASEVAQLYQTSAYATTYVWSTGATTASINVTPTQTTKYWLQVSNGISTCTDTVTITVQNPTAPAVSNVSYCQGATASALTATASAGNSLMWYSTATGGTGSSTAPTPSTTTVGSTTYYVSQITPQGCESVRASLTVTVNALPQASITASKTPIICTGDSVVFSVSPQVAGQSYVWYKDGVIITGASSTSYAAKQSGAYSVRVTNSNGCSITSATSTLNVYPWPTVNAGPDKEVPAGTSVEIITQTTNAQSIAWSPITGLSCINCASPTATVNFPIVYIVTVTSAGGCSVSDTVAIQLVCEDDLLYMPNTFTPNGDGENDRFYPMGKGLGEVTVFRIVNRLGQVVYTRSRFAINNASYGWDGTFNGADLGMDVYSYYIEVPCTTGQIIKKTGDISLLR